MLGLILSALPILGKLIPEGKTAEIVALGTKAAQELFGTTNEADIVAKMEADPKLAEQFKARLEADTQALQIESRNYELQIQDAANARAANLALATAHNPIAWSGPIIDVVVVAGFFAMLAMIVFRPVTMDQMQFSIANILLGILGGAFGQIINYHRGSSAGSMAKDQVINKITAENTSAAATVAAKVVEAAKKL